MIQILHNDPRGSGWQRCTECGCENGGTGKPPWHTDKCPSREAKYYGRDCPVGMVQVEFVSCDPKTRYSEYGWKPVPSAFLELWVDGKRFRVQVGTFHDGVAERRGLHIMADISVSFEKTAINAASLFFPTE